MCNPLQSVKNQSLTNVWYTTSVIILRKKDTSNSVSNQSECKDVCDVLLSTVPRCSRAFMKTKVKHRKGKFSSWKWETVTQLFVKHAYTGWFSQQWPYLISCRKTSCFPWNNCVTTDYFLLMRLRLLVKAPSHPLLALSTTFILCSHRCRHSAMKSAWIQQCIQDFCPTVLLIWRQRFCWMCWYTTIS